MKKTNKNLSNNMYVSGVLIDTKEKHLALLNGFILYSQNNKKKFDLTSIKDLSKEEEVFNLKFPEIGTLTDSNIKSSKIKIFTNDTRVRITESLDRNVLEILLFPFSRDITVQR